MKELNRLLSKRMSNIYLKFIIEKNWHFKNFDFLSLGIYHQVTFCEVPTHADVIES